MTWKEKVDQLAALLEKIPQPQIFDISKGVYQPYFLLELRPANWEILPYAEYTRLDGERGKEVKLSFQVVETQKVNITQEELNVLSYIYSFTNIDTRRLFSYGQPIGFLFEWLTASRIYLKNSDTREYTKLEFFEDTGNLSLGIFNNNGEYILQPAIVFQDYNVVIEDQTFILAANPLIILYKDKIYRVESNLPAFFWINFFRLQQQVHIPLEELQDFISSFVPQILPALDWKSLEDYLKLYELPLDGTRIYFKERAGKFNIDIQFVYRDIEFPARPVADKSLGTQGKYLFVVKRDEEKENQIRSLIQNHGLFYLQHRWQIDPQFKVLDWLRVQVPELTKAGIEFYGEEKLSRYKIQRGTPTLKINLKSGIDWLDLKYKLELDGHNLPILGIKDAILSRKKYFKLADGTNIHIPEELLNRLEKFYSLLGEFKPNGHQKFLATAFPLVDELLQQADDVDSDEMFEQWAKKFNQFDKINRVTLAESFNGKLRDYQQNGFDWLNFLHEFNFGGILADDMGLGKTVQVIALIQKLKTTGQLKNAALVVVPLTVIFNWQNELNRFAGNLKVLRYQGQKTEREKKANKFEEFDIILMSYGILLQDQEVLQSYQWDYIILDESQRIKNSTTKTYQAVTSIPSNHRLCLTGTPVENSVADLWSQFNFLNPGMLGSLKDFETRFMHDNENGKLQQKVLRRLIYPFMLRRKKEEVLKDLPEKTDIVQYVEMTDVQKKVYHAYLDKYRNQVMEEVEEKGIERSGMKILEALTALRQISCHPAILDNEQSWFESGKMELLEEMLEEILQEGHKVLIFSQFVRFLDIVKNLFEMREWKYEYLDGSTRKRENHIQNFQENDEVKIFLISLKAGGLGLNLTAADYVIHLDPWWNPAVEQQATDRAHRIGQQNPVFVYKYIVKNTVEEKILKLQEEKKELSDTLITSEKGLVKQLSKEDLQALFQPVD